MALLQKGRISCPLKRGSLGPPERKRGKGGGGNHLVHARGEVFIVKEKTKKKGIKPEKTIPSLRPEKRTRKEGKPQLN